MAWDFGTPQSSGSSGDWATSSLNVPSADPSGEWGDSPNPTPSEMASPPWLLFVLTALLPIAGIVLELVTDSLTWSIAAWCLAGPATIAMLAVYATVDALRRSNPWYRDAPELAWGRRLVVLLVLVGVALSAVAIADVVSRSA